jgi:hypothetical protein
MINLFLIIWLVGIMLTACVVVGLNESIWQSYLLNEDPILIMVVSVLWPITISMTILSFLVQLVANIIILKSKRRK